MNIEEAQYIEDTKTTIQAKVNGRIYFIPCDPANNEYKEILEQVEKGILTIKDAD